MFPNEDSIREIERLRSESASRSVPNPKSIQEQQEADRAFEEKQKAEAKAKKQLEQGIALQAGIRQTKHYIAEHQAKVVQWQASVDSMQKQLNDLFADGLVFPAEPVPVKVTEKPKPAPHFPTTAEALPDPFGDFKRTTHITCECCGEQCTDSAFHKRNLDGEYCIRNADAARKSGRFSPEGLAELIALTQTIKGNLQNERTE